jgi:uncharacterized membrane protein
MFPRGIVAALSLSAFVACQARDSSRRTDSAAAAGADSAPTFASPTDTSETPFAGALRAIGTEPFWGLDIDSTGLRFTTPEDRLGIRWPPLTPMVKGDTARWAGETDRAAVDARIWPARCSDGMSDRVWPYTAVVRIDSTTYRGCAESRARRRRLGRRNAPRRRTRREVSPAKRSPRSSESRLQTSACAPPFRSSTSGVPAREMGQATASS